MVAPQVDPRFGSGIIVWSYFIFGPPRKCIGNGWVINCKHVRMTRRTNGHCPFSLTKVLACNFRKSINPRNTFSFTPMAVVYFTSKVDSSSCIKHIIYLCMYIEEQKRSRNNLPFLWQLNSPKPFIACPIHSSFLGKERIVIWF